MENSLIIGAVQEKSLPAGYFEFLLRAINLGFSWVEFKYEASFDPHGQFLKDEGLRLGRLASNNNIDVSVHAAYDEGLNLGTTDQELLAYSRQKMRDSIQFAKQVGAKYLTMHGGSMSLKTPLVPQRCKSGYPFQAVREAIGDGPFQHFKDRVVSELAHLQSYALGQGVRLAVENAHGFSYDRSRFPITVQDFEECRFTLGDDLAIMFDSGHAHSTGLKPWEFIKAVGPKNVIGSHLHDNDGTFDQHRAIGEGEISFEAFLEHYIEQCWTFPLNIEVRTIEQLRHSKEFLRTYETKTQKTALNPCGI